MPTSRASIFDKGRVSMVRTNQEVPTRWDRIKIRIRATWSGLSEDKLEQHKSDQGKLERYIHNRTEKDLEGIRHRMDKLVKETEYRF